MEQQTSVFMPCVDVEEDERGIENESAPLDGLCSRTKTDTVAAPQVRQVYLITYSQAARYSSVCKVFFSIHS